MTSAILVMGATGTVGTEVVKELMSSDENISAADRSNSNVEKIKSQVYNDQNSETVYEGLKGVDKLFLLIPYHPNMVNLSATLIK